MYLKNEDSFNHLIVERYTLWDDDPKTILCINENNHAEGLVDELYINGLMEKSNEVHTIGNIQSWNHVFSSLGPKCTSTCSEKIMEDIELMVVEGFNDAVCPAPCLRYNIVLGVAPRAAVFYDPDDFHTVIDLKSRTGYDPMELRAKDIVGFIKPKRVITIPALNHHDIKDPDTLSIKLHNIIDIVGEAYY
jgi:predicted P-loop ATPase/GTPase